MLFRTALCVFGVLCFSTLTLGQSKTTASLTGTITDPTQAVVPDAKVSLKNIDTGQTVEASSDGHGEYSLPIIPPGTYEIRVEKAGFGTQPPRRILLTVGQTASADFQLAVGESTQTVEVQAEMSAWLRHRGSSAQHHARARYPRLRGPRGC